MLTIIITLLLAVLYLLAFPGTISAQVVINEFQLTPSNNQWIELYNIGDQGVDISGWVIDDAENGSASVYTIPGGTTLLSKKCISFKSANFDWNPSSADKVRVISPSGMETYSYLSSPGDGVSIGRIIDGQGDLTILSSQSRDAYNSTGESCLAEVISSTPTPTPTPTPAPTPYKATYKINTPKDNQGNILAGAQIFVDGIYVHHEDDEILQFFNGHECYAGVDCGLGTHTISLRKSGYLSWEDTYNFSAGENPEVNPVLNKLDQPAATTTPMVVPTPTKTPKTMPTKTPSPTESPATESAVLGIRTDPETTPSPTPEAQTSGKGKIPVLSLGLIFGGLCFIAVPIFSIIKNGKKDSEVS